MKNIFLFIALLFSTSVLAQDQYSAGMQKAFDLWGAQKNSEAAALFERISQAEVENWLPPYYAANVLIVRSFGNENKSLVNEMLEKAKIHIDEANKRSPNNSEITTMEGLLYTAYVAMEPETYGMQYSPRIMQLHSMAIAQDSLNPRAHLNYVEYEMGSARFFKQDLLPFCDKLEAVRPMFEAQKSDVPFFPSFGVTRIDEVKKQCGCAPPAVSFPPPPPPPPPGYDVKESKEDAAILECFNSYKSAILNDKGEKAVDLVDSRTISYYSEILEKVKTSDSTTINSMNIMDKLMVFSIRHRTSKEDIMSFDGKQLLVYAIQQGMVGKNSVANNEVGSISVNEDFAKGQAVINGKPEELFYHFYKEEGKWKMDLTSLFPAGTAAFELMAEQSGMEENEYLFLLLEMTSGDEVSDSIWDTIVK